MTAVPALPEGYTARRPEPGDAGPILAVVRANDQATLGFADFTLSDVEHQLGEPGTSPEQDHWVVTDAAGRIVTWGYLANPYGREIEELDVYDAPGTPPRVRAAVLDALLRRIAERARAAGATHRVAGAGAAVGDAVWADLLLERGFERLRRFAQMRIDLAPGRARPVPPAGVSVRGFDPGREQDWRDFHAVVDTAFADHWGHEPTTLAAFRARVEASPDPDYAQWWFADVDGRPVGALQSTQQSVDDGGGWIRHLAVLPGHRGRGIARTLLLHAFAAFAEAGRSWAGLGVDTASPTGAYRLYESVGMSPHYEADMLRRRVAAMP